MLIGLPSPSLVGESHLHRRVMRGVRQNASQVGPVAEQVEDVSVEIINVGGDTSSDPRRAPQVLPVLADLRKVADRLDATNCRISGSRLL